jgi:ABC-2 type transport system ATP-binding protein
MVNTPEILVENLTYRIRSREILKDLSFSINSGGMTVIVGENGAGKTTLLQMLMGLAKPTSGLVYVGGVEPWREANRDLRKVGYLAEKIAPPKDWSVREYLDFNRIFYGADYLSEIEDRLMRDFRIQGSWQIGNLSAGQTRRVQAIGVLAFRPKIIIVDEITAVLDIVGRSKFMLALKELCRESAATVIMATNILDDVDQYASDVILMNQGTICARGTKEEIIRQGSKSTLTDSIAKLIEQSEDMS